MKEGHQQFQQSKSDMSARQQVISEKINNEIIPLLNSEDGDIDELDDEVAMISYKKQSSNQGKKT